MSNWNYSTKSWNLTYLPNWDEVFMIKDFNYKNNNGIILINVNK